MNPRALLEKYYEDNDAALEIVYRHSRNVADKALAIAVTAGLPQAELDFIEEAALLHDIGVSRIYAPKLNCFGKAPYVWHGVIGREILDAEGLPRHAMVCERHIGVGLTAADIVAQNLRLPVREMSPVTTSERIVALADLFFSKKGGELDLEKSTQQVRCDLLRFGAEKVQIFENWLNDFGVRESA
ncbi:metal-dependent phosphohydrolase, HDc domain-containing [Citrifermentans bemidjiense Bem]|uniref:Metal-dependent phosphohydrolase, HDc domain-containing n=1 Tax=Citrifermentans bemidjiense (strain ATCC BAA-1014 / DSM 16622 / JCM 12645 / Bem) TaxID=404380 RepID=B5EFT8_CITBB|nr:HD domain-containing protein [Citrifermentans bemidjiense]ACH39403.1 metal-dependent phosphohydrolase, HDc domain-containing [Citrifermentans bemidjiense Bem]